MGIIDIFIVETNIDNAKIIIENLSDKNFSIYQDGYEKFCQSISKNDKQILKIYDQNCKYFIVKLLNSGKAVPKFKSQKGACIDLCFIFAVRVFLL